MYQNGIVQGRFQPLHLGHIEYILAGMSLCEKLWVGITNPDLELSPHEPTSPHRSLPESNPFRYFERAEMISASLVEFGIDPKRFQVVPFPLDNPERISTYVPDDGQFFVTIYDSWGWQKYNLLNQYFAGRVDLLWERRPSERLTSGTLIRQMIRDGSDNWREFVPKSVSIYIDRMQSGVRPKI
jgi:cytidyltransferase-like protein